MKKSKAINNLQDEVNENSAGKQSMQQSSSFIDHALLHGET